MRIVGAVALAFLIVQGGGQTAVAREKKPKPAQQAAVSAKQRDAAIDKGIRYLDKTVFSLPDASGTPQKQFTVAVTGLVHLLAKEKSSTSDDNKQVVKARKYLAKYIDEVARRTADKSQLPKQAGSFSSDHMMQYTWPIAMAGVFYGEMHTRGQHRADAKAQLGRIVEILIAAQRPNGGWGHGQVQENGKPRGSSVMDGFGGYPDTLLASSNLVATSLGLVKGIAAPKSDDVFEKAREYFRYAELSNGNFPYDPSQRSAQIDLTGVSRAAGAVLAMHLLGVSWKEIGVVRALEYIDEHFDYLSEGHGSSTHNLMLCAFLQRARGDEAWKHFKEVYFRRLLDGQQQDGSFECICQNKAFGSTNDSKPMGGKVKSSGNMPALFTSGKSAYVSAIHVLILLLDRSPPKIFPSSPAPKRGDVTPR